MRLPCRKVTASTSSTWKDKVEPLLTGGFLLGVFGAGLAAAAIVPQELPERQLAAYVLTPSPFVVALVVVKWKKGLAWQVVWASVALILYVASLFAMFGGREAKSDRGPGDSAASTTTSAAPDTTTMVGTVAPGSSAVTSSTAPTVSSIEMPTGEQPRTTRSFASPLPSPVVTTTTQPSQTQNFRRAGEGTVREDGGIETLFKMSEFEAVSAGWHGAEGENFTLMVTLPGRNCTLNLGDNAMKWVANEQGRADGPHASFQVVRVAPDRKAVTVASAWLPSVSTVQHKTDDCLD